MPVEKPQSKGLFNFCISVQSNERYSRAAFSSNLKYFGQKISHPSEIFGLLNGLVKIHKILHVIPQTASLLLKLFSSQFQDPIKVQKFRLSISPNFYFDKLLSLKVLNILAQKVRGIMSHDTDESWKV